MDRVKQSSSELSILKDTDAPKTNEKPIHSIFECLLLPRQRSMSWDYNSPNDIILAASVPAELDNGRETARLQNLWNHLRGQAG